MRYSKYPSYRDSGVEWLGNIPEHWIATKVKYEAPFQVGWTPATKDESNFIGTNTWVTIRDLKGRNITEAASAISDIAVANASMNITPKGSLLYSFKLSVGTVAFAGKDLYTNEAIASFLQNDKTDMLYLYYATPLFILQNASENIYGAKILNQELIKNTRLALPPHKEQQRIANYLDIATAKIDTLIEKQTKLIALLKEKRQAVISTAVTRGLDNTVAMKDSGVEWLGEIPESWEVWKMAHAFNTIGSGTTPSSTKESYYNGYIPWVTTGELRENTILNTKKLLTDEAIKDNSSLKLFPINSIIIAMYGATIGRLGVLGIKATTNQACCVMTDSSSIKNPYLYYWLMGYRDEIIKLGYGGGQPNISQDTISNLQVSAPSTELQEEIINYLDNTTSKIDNLISKSTKAIDLLKEKRTALISSAVTGKIDVREIA